MLHTSDGLLDPVFVLIDIGGCASMSQLCTASSPAGHSNQNPPKLPTLTLPAVLIIWPTTVALTRILLTYLTYFF